MKITKILCQKKGCRYNIYIDDEYMFSADDEDIIKNSINIGTELSKEELSDIIDKCEYTKAYNYSLHLLNIKDYLSNEIYKKLDTSGYSKSTINKVIEHLKELNLINDKKYIDIYIKEHSELNKESKSKIIYNLQKKGVDKRLLDNISINPDIAYNNALELASKKLKTISNDKNVKDKIYRFLSYKGYEYDIIKKVLSNLFDYDSADF